MGVFRQKDADMTHGPILGQLIQFAIPMMIGLLFQQLYNAVDIIVVGQFVGKQALAAVGTTSSIINTLVGFSAGLATGSSVVISQCYGAHDNKGLREAVHTTVGVTFILSAVFTALSVVLVDPLLKLMSTPADVMVEAQTYLRIYFAGLTGLLFYNMGSGVLRAVGDSMRPLYFLIFSALLNIVLDLLFVISFKMGVAGVGYATVLSQAISAVLVMVVLTREQEAYGVRWKEMRIHKPMLRRIVTIGFPAGLQQAVTAFSNVFVQSYVNYFGSACMAGWSSFNKLDMFLFIPPQSIGLAVTTYVGQNYGAGKLKRAKDGVTRAVWLCLGITIALAVIMQAFAPTFISLFTNEADVIAYGVRFLRIISPFLVLTTFNQIYAGALRGTGNSRTPMIVMLFSFVLFRQAFLFTVKLLGNELTWISLGYPMGWAMCSLLLAIFYHRSKFYKEARNA